MHWVLPLRSPLFGLSCAVSESVGVPVCPTLDSLAEIVTAELLLEPSYFVLWHSDSDLNLLCLVKNVS